MISGLCENENRNETPNGTYGRRHCSITVSHTQWLEKKYIYIYFTSADFASVLNGDHGSCSPHLTPHWNDVMLHRLLGTTMNQCNLHKRAHCGCINQDTH